MVGQISYTTEQIIFVLKNVLADKKRDIILYEYRKKFNKTLSVSQFRYIRNKYGHDPEFGTALVNRRLPENSGNRKMGESLSKGQAFQSVQPGKGIPYSASIQVPRPNSDHPKSLPAGYQNLKYLVDDTSKLSEKPDTSLVWPPREERSQRHPQPQLKHVAFPKSQPQPDTPEPSGTYWFDQYAPTAYHTPYGYQPVLHYNRQLLYPSMTQKRRLEEPDEVLPSWTAIPMTPIGGFSGLSSLSAAVPKPSEEPKAKRMRLELQNDGSGQMTTAIPVHMLMNNVLPQAMGQDNANYCDVAPSEEQAASINSDNADDVLYTNDDMEEFPPWSQFIIEADPSTQPEDSVTMPSSLQMPQTWDDHAYMNSTSAQGPTSATTSLSTATHTTTMSADTSLTFSNAVWTQSSDETEFGLENNHQASSFHSSPLLETSDPTLYQASGQAFQDALQAVVGGTIIETDPSDHGLDSEKQGQASSNAMAVQETAGFSDGLSFLEDLNDFEDDVNWDLESLLGDDLTPDVCPAQGVDDQTHSGHSD